MKNKSDFTFIEACNLLKKSKRTVSRYIKKGLITPEKIKSQRGSVEYRFKQADLEILKIHGYVKYLLNNPRTEYFTKYANMVA